jgi:hypothetical protein
MTRAEVQAEARKWLHTPYRQRGRTADGLDCIGFLVVVGRAFGVPHEDSLNYSDWPSQDHEILKVFSKWLVRLPIATTTELQGTIGAFAERRLPCHCGIFTEKHNVPHLIHARVWGHEVMEESWHQIPRDQLRLIGLFAFPGLEL